MGWNRSWMAVALTIAAAVSGCGGGGGGASSGPGTVGTGPTTPTVPPPVAASGLVPVAPTPGATLYADAAALRVLRAGAVWTYHGIEQPSGTSSNEFRAYTNTVTHAAAGTGIVESGSHPFNSDPENAPIRYQAGAYVSTN